MFGFRAYPTPIWRPLAPFIGGALVVLWGTNALQNTLLASDEFKNDPRNPHANKKVSADHH